MKISGVVQFQGMSAAAINSIREFQRNHSDVRITFSADLSGARAESESLESLALLGRLAESIQFSERKLQRGNKQGKQDRLASGSQVRVDKAGAR